ncbi:hypothetical protein WJX74_001066 [Apatococcus lobatus]|uniref:pyridoxal 5'-phosphate synthase n=1 Tax=Apatococcus lobatus TaxID=904363 RepID=A0AAW1R4F1_9CHLO
MLPAQLLAARWKAGPRLPVQACSMASKAAPIDEHQVSYLGAEQAAKSRVPAYSPSQSVGHRWPRQQWGVMDSWLARHLHHFGYKLQVCYPKQTDKPLYHGLVTQLQGAPKPPFDKILDMLKPGAHPPIIASVDCPSGWHVDNGDESGDGLRPDMLISLTAPKNGARHFDGKFHYVGGRFVPPSIQEKYGLQLPKYPGAAMAVKIGSNAAPKQNGKLDVASIRDTYEDGSQGLSEADADADPLKQFDKWFQEAVKANIYKEPNQMAIASSDAEGNPSVRMVLLKGYDERGFVFYSNYDSRKGKELSNGKAALCMYWEPFQRSVRIEGSCERVPPEESTAYFHSRPRGSQLGALVSKQSTVLQNGRQELEDRKKQLEQEYADESKEIPRPEHWGGYLVRPKSIEFWHGRPSRLHDRLQYMQENGKWTRQRLSP